jgi:hypothetical protein
MGYESDAFNNQIWILITRKWNINEYHGSLMIDWLWGVFLSLGCDQLIMDPAFQDHPGHEVWRNHQRSNHRG